MKTACDLSFFGVTLNYSRLLAWSPRKLTPSTGFSIVRSIYLVHIKSRLLPNAFNMTLRTLLSNFVLDYQVTLPCHPCSPGILSGSLCIPRHISCTWLWDSYDNRKNLNFLNHSKHLGHATFTARGKGRIRRGRAWRTWSTVSFEDRSKAI